MQRLTFEQHLLLMEALSRLTSKVRDRVAAGETSLQDTLRTLETIERTVAAGTVHSEPAKRPTAAGRKERPIMKINTHEVLLLQAAVNELVTEIRTKVEAGDYWLTRTLHELEELNHKLHSTVIPHRNYGIREAA